MAPDVPFQMPSLLHNSTKIKLILVMLALACETCIYAVAETDQVTSPASMGEVVDEIGNPFPSISEKGFPSSLNTMSIEDQNDLMTYKRHLGAIAALSGSRQLSGSRSFTPPSKKHIGSIAAAAAQSMGRTPAGRKLDLLFPTKVELYKRHLGALMALSGAKSRPLTRSLKESSGYQMDSQAGAFEMENPPMSLTRGSNIMDVGGNGIVGDTDMIIPAEIQSPAPGVLLEYADELSPLSSSENEFQHMNNDEVLDQNLASGGLDVVAYKSKRFLGPLARGGWFPRHFRGIVSENTFGKRHIGALARLGWMPHAKGNSRLLALDDRGEIGLKRNDALPRRRMLYHFTAPSLWTSPRGK